MKKTLYNIGKISLIVLAFSHNVSAKNKLDLSCQILDPNTSQEKTTFAAGDEMLLSLGVHGPNDGNPININKDQKLAVQISSTAKIKGVKFPFSLKNTFSVPLSKTIDTDTENFDSAISRIIKIPNGTPGDSKLNLKIKVSLSSVGSKTCKKSIFIQ